LAGAFYEASFKVLHALPAQSELPDRDRLINAQRSPQLARGVRRATDVTEVRLTAHDILGVSARRPPRCR
jgi:hypothetical protein